MRATKLKIRKVRISGVPFWQVITPKQGGGRTRRTFKEKTEAEAYFDAAKVQHANHGTASLSVPEKLRVEAKDCADRLAVHGKTLRDATDYYLEYLSTVTSSRKVREVVEEFLAAKEADGASGRYLGDLRVRLSRFALTFGESIIASITARELNQWLRSLGVGNVTRNSYRRRLTALFNFARKEEYLARSPLVDVDKPKERAGETEILTVAQMARLLEVASAETLPYWAIGGFAGLRRAELERLEWKDVDLEGGFINVSAAKAKTASRRLVTIQPNLREWLSPYSTARGLVCPAGLRKRLEADREAAGMGQDWPQNGLRHSFGSYHLAQFADAAALALQMGNSPNMIFKHYREVVKPKDAAAYWGLSPAHVANLIKLSA
jgi:integrase